MQLLFRCKQLFTTIYSYEPTKNDEACNEFNYF